MADIALGTRLFVSSGEPATFDQTGFAAKAYSQVTNIDALPAFGVEASTTDFTPLATGITESIPGIIKLGQLDFSASRHPVDAGQVILLTEANEPAGASKRISCRVNLADASIYYFAAHVIKGRILAGAAGDVVMNEYSLSIYTRPIGPF